jgi:hypothetical protein
MATGFQTPVLSVPGLTWVGTRSAATRELATRVDAKWLKAMQQPNPREWWLPFIDTIPTEPGIEVVKLPIDFEDLAEWQSMNGQRVAREVKPLSYQVLAGQPFYKDRRIRSRDIERNAFGSWPDRLTSMMISARRMVGVLVRDALFSSGTDGAGAGWSGGPLYTYQGNGATKRLIAASGHLCDPTEPGGMTFGNLHTSTDQAATSTSQFVKGATPFNQAGWEAALAAYLGRLGPGQVPLDMGIKYVLGGSAMRPKFARVFKRVLVLEDSASGPAAAAVTNIHNQQDLWLGEEPVIPIVSAWLDQHPYLVANPTADQWWTVSTSYPARPFGVVLENGGAPTVKVLDIGSEYEIEHDEILIKGTMTMGIGAAFPHTIDEWRST